MDLKYHMPWLCWELPFSMLCMLCTDKGSSLNLDLMNNGNFVVIMIMIIFIYINMYECHCLIGSSGIILLEE